MLNLKSDSLPKLLISLIIVFILNIINLPYYLLLFRPYFLAVWIIYFALRFPGRVSLIFAWFLGLLFDTAAGSLLGQNALYFLLVAYLSLYLQRIIKVFPFWQQAACIFLILLSANSFVLSVKAVITSTAIDWRYIITSFVTSCFWPIICYWMDIFYLRNTHHA